MKTIALCQQGKQDNWHISSLRILALSATMPNVDDVASWLTGRCVITKYIVDTNIGCGYNAQLVGSSLITASDQLRCILKFLDFVIIRR